MARPNKVKYLRAYGRRCAQRALMEKLKDQRKHQQTKAKQARGAV